MLHQAPIAVIGDGIRISLSHQPLLHGSLWATAERSNRGDLVHALERLQVIVQAQRIPPTSRFVQKARMILGDVKVVLVQEPRGMAAHACFREGVEESIETFLPEPHIIRPQVAINCYKK